MIASREYAQTPRPPPFRLGMTRLAQHDDEVFKSWRDQDEFSAAEFFPVPPILPDPARRPDFESRSSSEPTEARYQRHAAIPRSGHGCLGLALHFPLDVDVPSAVEDYREALRRRDEEASQGRRGPTSTQPSQSHPTCAPVNPMIDETAVEYAGVWVLKLAYREGRQRAHILGNFYNTLQDIVAFANWRLRGPRIHYSVVADLVRWRAQRANGDFVAAGGGWDRSHGYEQPADFPSQGSAHRRVILNRSLPCAIDTSRRIISVAARQADALVRVLSLVDGIPKRVVLVLVLVDGILKRVVPVPVPRRQSSNSRSPSRRHRSQVREMPQRDAAGPEPAAAPSQQPQQPDLHAEQVPEPQGEPTNAARVDHAVNQRLSVLEEGVHAIRALLVAALPAAAAQAPEVQEPIAQPDHSSGGESLPSSRSGSSQA
ncbi:hypothetical protein AC1031_007291 [Aphanomyces cochlioides]|nr:hypothetical protein AC1031_007291 [Aphanomyces cochlioides]